jgi:hypothetical protein
LNKISLASQHSNHTTQSLSLLDDKDLNNTILAHCFSCRIEAKQHGKQWPAKFESKSQGHKITLCVDGADVCNRRWMEMKLSRLLEVDANGTDVGNSAKNFNNPNFVNYTWSTPESILDDQNVSIGTRVRLDTDLLIGKPKDDNYASFSLITELFSNDTTVIYANETIEVAKNAMK